MRRAGPGSHCRERLQRIIHDGVAVEFDASPQPVVPGRPVAAELHGPTGHTTTADTHATGPNSGAAAPHDAAVGTSSAEATARPGPSTPFRDRIGHPGHHRRRQLDEFDDRDRAGVESGPGRWVVTRRCGRLRASRIGWAVREPSESISATPIGSFGLTQAFGRAPNPGTALPYFVAGPDDWWVSDASSRYYNTHQICATACPFNTAAGENLYQAGFVYTYAVVIDYNRFPARAGAGSAFFLHVTDGGPTAGCVSIPQATLVSFLAWLEPSAHPRILIGVG